VFDDLGTGLFTYKGTSGGVNPNSQEITKIGDAYVNVGGAKKVISLTGTSDEQMLGTLLNNLAANDTVTFGSSGPTGVTFMASTAAAKYTAILGIASVTDVTQGNSYANLGSVTVPDGKTVTLAGTGSDIVSGAATTGSGRIVINYTDSSITNNVLLQATGVKNITLASSNSLSGGSKTIASGTTLTVNSGATLTLSANLTVQGAIVISQYGSLTGTGSYTITTSGSGTVNYRGLEGLTTNGAVTGANFEINANRLVTDAAKLTNSNAIDLKVLFFPGGPDAHYYGAGSASIYGISGHYYVAGDNQLGAGYWDINSGMTLGGSVTATGAAITGTDAAVISSATFTLSIYGTSIQIADSGYAGSSQKSGLVTFSGVQLEYNNVIAPLPDFIIGVRTAR
jgi:hypothetical protein